MVSPSAQPASRYRRRILGIGALLTGALYVIGAPVFVNGIEDDLDQRVPAELDAAGYEGITASFSGQDGTLTCRAPLEDPERARAAAYAIWGVRAIELDRSCRVNQAPPSDQADQADQADDAGDETVPAPPAGSGDDGEPPATTVAPITAAESELATVGDIVDAHPDLAFLSVLLAGTDTGGPAATVTLFAPSNAAFDAVPSDVLGQLQNDPELLEQLLAHHVVEGAIRSTELTTGQLTARDGTPLSVVVDGGGINVGDAAIVDPDIIASNGVVHVIDSVIMPPADAPSETEAATAAYDGVSVTLSGVVAGEEERDLLVEAATSAAGELFVQSDLTLDEAAGIDLDTAESVAVLVRAMPDRLLSGEVGFDGDVLFALGVVASDADGEAFVAAAAEVGVEPRLSAPQDATDDDAAELEARLNQFVEENPILFEPSSAVLDLSAFAVIDRIALDAQQVASISITVEGHTDSDGIPIENLQLSQNRAEAVRDALIERGVADVVAVGFGSEQPVLVDGVEDKDASRRVEFRVVTTS